MSIEIAGHNVKSGDKLFSSLRIDCPHDCIEVPLFVVAGTRSGPTFCFISGEHGTELTGPEAIRRFIEGLDPATLTGNVVAVPVVNPRAMRAKQHSYPYDRWVWFNELNDLSSAWPGRPDGNPAECTTHVIYNEIIVKSQALASLHCTNYRPYLACLPGDLASRQLCFDYGRIGLIYETKRPGGCVQYSCPELGIPGLLVEWPPLQRINHTAIAESLIGMANLLKSMGMLAGTPRKISDQYFVDYDSSKHAMIHADDDGVLVREKAWGAPVAKGEVIARIYDFYRYREVQCITSPMDGILNNTGPQPPHLATFFMQTDSVVKGELVAWVAPYIEHVCNKNGDPWLHTLMGGPESQLTCLM